MPWLRKRKDENRSQDGGESQTPEGESSWIKKITDAASSWEEQQMEEETRRNIGIKGIKMNHNDILSSAINIIRERGNEYGDIATNFTRTADLASTRLDKKISAYDVAVILSCLKQSRLSHDNTKQDSWIDLVAYEAIAASLANKNFLNDVILANVESRLNDIIGVKDENS